MSESKILTIQQIEELETEFRKQFVLSHPGLMLNLSMLVSTVRHLLSLVYVPKILPDDEEITYQQDAERLLREKIALREENDRLTRERNEALDQCTKLHHQLSGTIK